VRDDPLTRQQRQVLQALRVAGSRGVHSFELRVEGVGNPSQRITELCKHGCVIASARERLPGKTSFGTRWILREAPDAIVHPRRAASPYVDGAPGAGEQLALGVRDAA
jgi:hypothetical protein